MDAAAFQPADGPGASSPTPAAIDADVLDELWRESDASAWGLERNGFARLLLIAATRQNFGLDPGHTRTRDDERAFFKGVRLPDLVLATACAEGNERAWEHFMALYGPQLTRAAIAISGSETVGRDLSDAFYAELYGLNTRDGERRCPLVSYRGRGSLIGWLRTTLAQRFVDHYRRTYREEAFEDLVDDVPSDQGSALPDPALVSRLSAALEDALSDQPAEERFVLASYYLDGRTLADIAGVLGVHEATVSRRLKRATQAVRKRLVKSLEKNGMSRRAAEEALGTDPRDVDLGMDLKKLMQHSGNEAFPEPNSPDAAPADRLPGAWIPNASRAFQDKAKTEG